VNVVALIGNLATDVDVRDVSGGHRRASFLLAVDRRGSRGEADFFEVTAWDRLAARCERFLTKGRRIALDGKLRSRRWEAADGTQRRAVEVVADDVQFLWTRAESAREGADVEAAPLAEVVHLAERSMA
jgi:single-strand DNA-binding protein